MFQEVAPGQRSEDLVGRPLIHKSGLKQATGEAVYIDDMPTFSSKLGICTWVKVFSINPEFRILRLTLYGKSASKC